MESSIISKFFNVSEGVLYDCYESGSIGIFKQESQDIQFWLEIAKKINGNVLEIGCGTGRITTHLAQNDIKITGIDISEDMLNIARKKSSQVSWIQSDMRNFNINDLFDLIIIPYNCFLMLPKFDDAEACLTSIQKHLRLGGKLVIDIENPSPEFLFPLLYNERKCVSSIFEHPYSKKVIVVTRHRKYDSTTQILCFQRSYKFLDSQEIIDEEEFFRIYFPQEIEILLHHCKFTVEKKYGNYNFEPFISESQKQLLICSTAQED